MEEIPTFILIILSDPDLKHDFISCLDQYVSFGNKGRNLHIENNMKIKLSEYCFQGKTKNLLQSDLFFVQLYNKTKKFLSRQYTIQRLHEVKDKLQKISLSVDQLLENIDNQIDGNFFQINNYAERIMQFDDPFMPKSSKKKSSDIEKKNIIREIDLELNNNFMKKHNYMITNDVSFVLSVLSEGLSFSVVERLFAKNNISICSEKTFYLIMAQLRKIIIEQANKECFKNFLNMKDDAILGFDSSWAHKRKSWQCFGVVIDTFSDKIVGWNVVQNQCISPQSLEIEVFKSMKSIYLDDRVKGHVQDGDVNTIKLIKQWKKSIILYFDPNHINGKFQRILQKFNEKGNNCFKPIYDNLTHFFKLLLYNKSLTINQKKFQWENAVNHFLGIHGLCLHSYINPCNCPDPVTIETEFSDKEEEESEEYQQEEEEKTDQDQQKKFDKIEEIQQNDEQFSALPSEANTPAPYFKLEDCPNLIYYLTKFLDYTKDLFDFVSPYYTTQSNESVNGLKSKMANKNTNWKSSFEMRMGLTVLQKNNPYHYYNDLLETLSLPKISDESQIIISKYIKKSEKKKEKYLDPNYTIKRNRQRNINRNKKFSNKDTDHITHFKEMKKTEKEINNILKSFRPIKFKINDISEITIKNSTKKDYYSDSDEIPELESDESDESSSSQTDENPDEDFEDDYLLSRPYDLFPKPDPDLNSGLVNLNNTCYISSALQVIFQLPFIANILSNPKDCCNEIADSINNTYYGVRFSDISYIPIEFVRLYKSLYKIADDNPNDAMECIVRIFDIIKSNYDFDLSLYYIKYNQNIICHEGHLICDKLIDELFFEIYLINNCYKDIQECIYDFFNNKQTKEILCSAENEVVQCTIKNDLVNIPQVICIHFINYYYNQESQNAERVQFNLIINEEIYIESTIFSFKCALLHIGGRNSGHYQVLLKHQNNLNIIKQTTDFQKVVFFFSFTVFKKLLALNKILYLLSSIWI